jgi:hypothetical protein
MTLQRLRGRVARVQADELGFVKRLAVFVSSMVTSPAGADVGTERRERLPASVAVTVTCFGVACAWLSPVVSAGRETDRADGEQRERRDAALDCERGRGQRPRVADDPARWRWSCVSGSPRATRLGP